MSIKARIRASMYGKRCNKTGRSVASGESDCDWVQSLLYKELWKIIFGYCSSSELFMWSQEGVFDVRFLDPGTLFSAQPMKIAAEEGSLTVVQWLKKKGYSWDSWTWGGMLLGRGKRTF